MRSIAALEAKNRFGELLNAAQREPVTIEKHGKPVAVMISAVDYAEIESMRLALLKTEIAKGMDDIEAGRIVEGARAFRGLRARFKSLRCLQ